MDVLTPEQRIKNMQAIKGKNTRPELIVRKILHNHGYRFRLHRKDLPGKPDIVLPKYKTVIFVNGCFWHRHLGCKYAAMPSTNRDFWRKKFEDNIQRDTLKQNELKKAGWKVIIIWSCEINRMKRTGVLPDELKKMIH